MNLKSNKGRILGNGYKEMTDASYLIPITTFLLRRVGNREEKEIGDKIGSVNIKRNEEMDTNVKKDKEEKEKR